MDIEDWLDPPEHHRELWWAGELEYLLPMSEQSDPPRLGEPWTVGKVAGVGQGRSIFRHRLPAVKFTDFGPAGRSHFVQQQTQDGAQVVRHLHPTEVDRLFREERVPMEWGDLIADRQARQGNSAPPQMMLPVLQGVARFCEPVCPFVPRDVRQVITDDQVLAYRGHLMSVHKDFVEAEKRGLIDLAPGQERVGTSTHKELAAEGGLVFQTEVPMPFYLGDYWVSGDVDDIVPAAHLRHPVASVRQSALAALARWYPDQELVRCLTGDGVPSKDAGDPRTAFVATNHKKALSHHRLVHEMYAGEVEEKRMLQFGLGQVPAFFPSLALPTGATVKKDREGNIDPDVIRPTADYSWPPKEHWLRWLVCSPNEAVDLDVDFPWVYYASTRDYIEQVLFLDAFGSGVS